MTYCRKICWLLPLIIAAGCKTTAPLPPDVDLAPSQPAVVVVTQPKHVIPPPKVVLKAPVAAPAPNDHLSANATWVLLERWCADCGFGAVRRIPGDAVAPAFSFNAANGTMFIRIGSELASWRGMEYHLGFAPELIDGQPFVHALDIRKNFMPLIENPVPLAGGRVIVIDPGHGGADIGASNVVTGHFEKEYTLDLARRLQAVLAAQGWTAILTRTSDVAIGLSDRVAVADQHNAALFVSLHFNSSFPDRHQSGLETFCVTPQGMHSTETRGFEDIPSLAFPNNRFDIANLQFAARVHRELLAVNDELDRGVKHARFLRVLREQNRPAFLIEGGFLSNPVEARKISEPAFRQKMAETIARAMQEEAGLPPGIASQENASATPAISQTPGTNQPQDAAIQTNASVPGKANGTD